MIKLSYILRDEECEDVVSSQYTPGIFMTHFASRYAF
jgi:hypothetical protein